MSFPLRLPTSLAVIYGSFTLGLYVAIQGPTLMDLIDLLHVNNDIMSYTLAFASLAYSVGGLLSGFLFNYVNRQILIAGYFFIFGLANIITPFVNDFMLFSVITVFKMMCAGGTDCGANVWILEMWPGKDAWLQALHFSFAVGCALGPLIVEPFLSVEYKDNEMDKLAGKTSGSTTINDQNNETRIHVPYGFSGLCCIGAGVAILYLYWLDNKRKQEALQLLVAKQQSAAGENILLTNIKHPAQLEAGGLLGGCQVLDTIDETSSLKAHDHDEQDEEDEDEMKENDQEEEDGGGGGGEGGGGGKGKRGNKALASVLVVDSSAQAAITTSTTNQSTSSSAPPTPTPTPTPVAGSTHHLATTTTHHQQQPLQSIQNSSSQTSRPQTPTPTTTIPQPANSITTTLPSDPATCVGGGDCTTVSIPEIPAQPTKITSKAREQTVGRPPYYVMVAIALAAMCLSFYCGIEITSMNYLASFAVNIDLQLPKSTAALMSSALTISFAVGRGFGIWIAPYMKPHKLFYLCAGIMATGNVFMLIFANTAETLLWYSICIFGIGCGPMFPAIVSFYDDRISKVTNTVSGIFILGSMFNVALNSLIIGHHIIDNALILIVCNLIGSILLMLLFGTLHMLTRVKKNQRVKKFNRLKQSQLQQQQQQQQQQLLLQQQTLQQKEQQQQQQEEEEENSSSQTKEKEKEHQQQQEEEEEDLQKQQQQSLLASDSSADKHEQQQVQ